MPLYKIAKVHDDVRDWKNQRGDAMKSYRIDLADAQGQIVRERCELAQKESTQRPVAGNELDGEIQHRTYGDPPKDDYKFKKAYGGGAGGGGRSWKPRPDDAPEVYAARQAMIARQHSQDVGMKILELAQASGDDVAVVMDRLGISYAKGEETLTVLDAVAKDVAVAGFRAWIHETGEETQDSIKDALGRLA
jgi:hypothetical protein